MVYIRGSIADISYSGTDEENAELSKLTAEVVRLLSECTATLPSC